MEMKNELKDLWCSKDDSEIPPIGYRINELANLIQRSAIRNYMSTVGVPVVEAWTLRQIAEQETTSARELSRLMSLDEGQISRAMKSLAEKKLILRKPDPKSSRRKLIKLTAKGRRACEVIDEIHRARAKALADGLNANDLQRFFEILKILGANANELLDEGSGYHTSSEAPAGRALG